MRYEILIPGNVGSVGDTNMTFRLATNTPESPIRIGPYGLAGTQRLGSNVQDGYPKSYDSGGGGARVYDGYFRPKTFRHAHGYTFQDLRVPDCAIEPLVGETPRYGWNNLVGNVYDAKRTGFNFMPLPGAFRLPDNQVSRGQKPLVYLADEVLLNTQEVPFKMVSVVDNQPILKGKIERMNKFLPTKR